MSYVLAASAISFAGRDLGRNMTRGNLSQSSSVIMAAGLLSLSIVLAAWLWMRTGPTLNAVRLTAAQLPSPPFPRRIHGLWPLRSRNGSYNILMRLRGTVSLHLRGGAGLLVEGSFTG